ncbi:MAG: recombination mediator RecR, partial [Lactobacillales bacterium]|nr:recombination mediator RecR [Lactobacillales bacterium]
MSANQIEKLILLLSKMPSLGPRSARRIVLHLLKKRESQFEPLIASMQDVLAHIKECSVCGNMDVQDPCSICANTQRANGQLCVVQDVTDLWAVERAGVFKGKYHVLGGVLSALDGVGPEELRIDSLIKRIPGENVSEIILALPTTVEGQTTIHYLMDRLESLNVKISTLSRGVPVGGELDYLDDGTLQLAFK